MPDGELLRRFLANDERAFAELVRRHGRLVWAVCRHLTRSDAEADDAFQATFLVLLKNAKKVRDAGKLSAWLHGVAYKVCAKTRQAAQRRQAREHAMAAREGNGSAVPDSAWDRALAAVHEEVAKLPETLRVPFVLCCLEGIGVTEAAAQLGWKLGTLSGRLTRAKDAVLVKLEARGMTLGIVATVGIVSVPTAVAAKATALAQVGFAVPISILQLSQGVIGMSMKSVKMLAAAVMVTCGLGLGVGTGWVTHAEAQTGSAAGTPSGEIVKQLTQDPKSEVQRLQAELDRARAVAEQRAKVAENLAAFIGEARKSESKMIGQFKTAKWEYGFADKNDAGATEQLAFLQQQENLGWEFLGAMNCNMYLHWLFRRPVKGAEDKLTEDNLKSLHVTPKMKSDLRYDLHFPNPPKVEDAKSIEAEIKKLQEKLSVLREKKNSVVIFSAADLPVAPDDFVPFLSKLADKKFPMGRVTITKTEAGIQVYGDKEVCDWATGVVKSLKGTSPQGSGRHSDDKGGGEGSSNNGRW